MARQGPVDSVLDDLKKSGRSDAVSAGEILEAFEHRSLGMLLTVFGLITILPVIGDIPGAAITMATLIVIASLQSLAGRGRLWMPDFVRRHEFRRSTFDRNVERLRPWVRWIDRLLKPRLLPLVDGRKQRRAVAIASALLGLLLYPLAFVPFGANAPALGTIAFGLGLAACDGLMVLLGYALVAVTVGVGIYAAM